MVITHSFHECLLIIINSQWIMTITPSRWVNCSKYSWNSPFPKKINLKWTIKIHSISSWTSLIYCFITCSNVWIKKIMIHECFKNTLHVKDMHQLQLSTCFFKLRKKHETIAFKLYYISIISSKNKKAIYSISSSLLRS
jgi:hypothetical protein